MGVASGCGCKEVYIYRFHFSRSINTHTGNYERPSTAI